MAGPPLSVSGQGGFISMAGIDETIARLKSPTLLNRPIRKFWVAASVILIKALQDLAPRSPNHKGPNRPLWASHISEIDEANPARWLKIRNVTSYHRYVVEGTRAHIILPRYKKALYWEGAAHPYALVHHPGTKPNDYMQRAVNQVRGQITHGEPSQVLHAEVKRIWDSKQIEGEAA